MFTVRANNEHVTFYFSVSARAKIGLKIPRENVWLLPKAATVKIRTRWVEFEEKNSNYFLGSERINSDRKSITSLRSEHDDVICEQQSSLPELVTFYESL